jgi:hypothetical protein
MAIYSVIFFFADKWGLLNTGTLRLSTPVCVTNNTLKFRDQIQ